MFYHSEAVNSAVAEMEAEIQQKTDDIMSGKCTDEKKVIQYVHGIRFALARLSDASNRSTGRKRKDDDATYSDES